jgi:hypothetical protein
VNAVKFSVGVGLCGRENCYTLCSEVQVLPNVLGSEVLKL